MVKLDDLVGLKLEDPIVHENIGIRPVVGNMGKLDFLVYNKDIASDRDEQGKVYVDEMGRRGPGNAVGVVNVVNGVDNLVLIPQGTLLIGGNQNRQVLESMLLRRGFQGIIPTKCQEKQRWRDCGRGFNLGGSASTKNRYEYDQHRSWVSADDSLTSLGYRGSDYTQVLSHEGVKEYVDFFLSELEKHSDLTGLIVAFPDNGDLFIGADIFNNPDVMKVMLEDLVKGYAAHANEQRFVAERDGTYDEKKSRIEKLGMRTEEFYQALKGADYLDNTSGLTIGNKFEVVRDDISSTGLVHDSKLVHLYAVNQKVVKKASNPLTRDDFTQIGSPDEYNFINEVELPQGTIIFGRGDEDDFRSRYPDMNLGIRLDDSCVSRIHAKIDNDGEKLYLTDLDSSNGTYLNGSFIDRQTKEVTSGSVISICKMNFRYEVDNGQSLLYRPKDDRKIMLIE